jgi:hypothetical protein
MFTGLQDGCFGRACSQMVGGGGMWDQVLLKDPSEQAGTAVSFQG